MGEWAHHTAVITELLKLPKNECTMEPWNGWAQRDPADRQSMASSTSRDGASHVRVHLRTPVFGNTCQEDLRALKNPVLTGECLAAITLGFCSICYASHVQGGMRGPQIQQKLSVILWTSANDLFTPLLASKKVLGGKAPLLTCCIHLAHWGTKSSQRP